MLGATGGPFEDSLALDQACTTEGTESVMTHECHYALYKAALLLSGSKNQVIMSDVVRTYYVPGATPYLCVLVYLILIIPSRH